MFQWPNGAKAAVCLTYDDGVDVHLDHALPDLEAAKLHGAFYVTGQSQSLFRRMAEWRNLVKSGHELGSHSIFHPCVRTLPGGEVRDWVTPARGLENYTVPQIVNELRSMNTTLLAIDGNRARTYAYTCGEYRAGGQSFVDELRPLFTAARGGQGRIVSDPMTVDLHLVPSWGMQDIPAEGLIDYVKAAVAGKGLAVFMFHGIGGGHGINTEREAHQGLLAWLAANRNLVWTDTFANVTNHIVSERKRMEK